MATTFEDLNAELFLTDADGNIQFDKDKEAARAYHLEYVNVHTRFFHSLEEKTRYLLENELWDKATVETFTTEQFKELFKRAYSYKFRFQSFMGARKFYQQYALMDIDGTTILERFEDRVVMTAIDLSNGDFDQARDLIDAIITGRFQPATPTFLNAGRAQGGERVSCFLIRVDDNTESINRAFVAASQLSRRGGGVGLNMTNIRESGATIQKTPGASKGLIPFMKVLEDEFKYFDQLGQRQGAGVVYVNAHHPDIMQVMDTKRENADESIRIKTLSIGVIIPDITFRLARDKKDMYLFSPSDVEKVEGKPFSDLSVTDNYDKWVDDDRITKRKVEARKFFQTLSELQFESGYPYVMFEDEANRTHTLRDVGRIQQSNLCVAPETLLLTRSGNVPIVDLAGQDVEVWNGEEWSLSRVEQTGQDQPLITVDFDNGASMDVTPYHKFYIQTECGVQEVRAQHLNPGDRLEDYRLPDGSLNEVSVVSVTDNGRTADTYCLNEPKRHKVIFNGVQTGNCSEILQVQTPSIINEDLSYEVEGEDISCNLGSLNIDKMWELSTDEFVDTVVVAVRALDQVSRSTSINAVPTVRRGNESSHSIGLGQMNLHGALGVRKIWYDSDEARAMYDRTSALITFAALTASNQIAKETGETFENYKSSTYADSRYFDEIVWPKVEEFGDNLEIVPGLRAPTREEWAELQENIWAYGIANAYLQAVPPTGSISYINNSTSSIHPVAAPIEIRKEGKTGRTYYPAPGMNNDNLAYFQSAAEIGWKATIDMYEVGQHWIDQGMSLTLFFPDKGVDEKTGEVRQTTTRDLDRARIYAWRHHIKTLYYIRIRQAAMEGTQVEGTAMGLIQEVQEASCQSCLL